MERGRRTVAKRVGVVAAGVLLVGLVASGVATAQARTDTPSPAPVPVVGNALDSLSGTSDTSSDTSGSSGAAALVPDLSTSTSSTSTSSTSTSSTSTSSTSTSSTSTSSTSSTSSSTSNGTYTITFPPTLPPGYGQDGGHRYYGRYWDAAANCWRYASPGYVAPVVVASQVSSVPKGGVDTGDGSFR